MKPIPHTVQLYHLNSNMNVEQRYRVCVLYKMFCNSVDGDEFLTFDKPTQKTFNNSLNAWSASSDWLFKDGKDYYRKAPACKFAGFHDKLIGLWKWVTSLNLG